MQMFGGTSSSTPRDARADVVKALPDAGEAHLYDRLELGVGEDVGSVVLDALAHQLADVGGIDAMGVAFTERPDHVGQRTGRGNCYSLPCQGKGLNE
jgi:hypothetical protein